MMSKKTVNKPEASVKLPELKDFIANKLKQPTQKNTAEQLKVFWNDFNFQLGESGRKLKEALKTQFYNTQQPINWARDREGFLEDLSFLTLVPEQLENLKIGYLYAVYNITRETLKKELTQKLVKYQDMKKEAEAQIEVATKSVSPKKKSKIKNVEEYSPIDVEKLKIHIAGIDTVVYAVMKQLKDYKERMVAIKNCMDKSTANSKPSSPAHSPSGSPRSDTMSSVAVSPKTAVKHTSYKSTATSTLSSPAQSPSVSPRSATVSSVTASARRLTIGTRRVVSTSVEEASSRDKKPESPNSTSQPGSPRNTVNASPRLTSANRFTDTSARRLTIGSRKRTETKDQTLGSLELSSEVIALPSIDKAGTESEIGSYTDLTLGSPKPTKKLPVLPLVSGDASLKRETVTLTRESSWGQPVKVDEDANLARGSLPVIKESPVPPLRFDINSASIGRGRGSGGRGKPVRPPAPSIQPAPVVVEPPKPVMLEVAVSRDNKPSAEDRNIVSVGRGKAARPPLASTSLAPAVVEQLKAVLPVIGSSSDDKSSLEALPNVSGYGSISRAKGAGLLASSDDTVLKVSPRKGSMGRGNVVTKPAVPRKVSEQRRQNLIPFAFSRDASRLQKVDQNRPELPAVLPVHPPEEVQRGEDQTLTAVKKQDSEDISTIEAVKKVPTVPNLRIGTHRPKPAARVLGKIKPKSTIETPQSDDENEIIIQGRNQGQALPEKEVLIEDLARSSQSEEEKPQLDQAKRENTENKDLSYDEEDTASVSEQTKTTLIPDANKENNSLSDEAAKETPRRAALKELPEDKASRILKAIIYPSDFTRTIARQEYRVKDYKAVDTVIKKFKGFDAKKIAESYLFEEDNTRLRELVVKLFDYLVVLQDEQLKWETPPPKYHFKNNGEAKIEGLVGLFNTLADPNSNIEEAKKQIEVILESKEDKGLLKNRGTGAYFIGSIFRREKNPVNKQYIRSTTERKLVEIYNVLNALESRKKDSFAETEVEQSEVENRV